MNPERLQKARDLVTALQGTEVELAKVASPVETRLIREMLGYETRESLTETDQERLAIIRSFLTEEDDYKRRPAKPMGDFQPIPAKTVDEQNAIATKWAMDSASGAIPQTLENVLMGSMLAHMIGVPDDQIPSGLKFETVDGYKPMLARAAAAERMEKLRKDAIDKALARLNRKPWYQRLALWLKRPFVKRRPETELSPAELVAQLVSRK